MSTSTYIYIYAFSRRFYPKRLTVHSGYTVLCQYVSVLTDYPCHSVINCFRIFCVVCNIIFVDTLLIALAKHAETCLLVVQVPEYFYSISTDINKAVALAISAG